MLFLVINFLKCVATEVILFSTVAVKTLHVKLGSISTYLRCGGIFTDNNVTNILLILTVK